MSATESDVNVRIRGEAGELLAAMRDATGGVREGVADMRTNLEGLRRIASTAMAGVVATFAASEIRKSINTTVELTKGAIDMGKQLGVSATQASILKVALGDVYVEEKTLQTAAERLTTTLRMNESAITDLGVKTRDQNGNLRATVPLMADVNAALLGLKSGTDRNVAGQRIYGRGWLETMDILKLTPAVMADAERKARELGLAVGEDGVEKTNAYRAAMNDLDDVITGIRVNVGNMLMPVFTSFTGYAAGKGSEGMRAFRAAVGSVLILFVSLKTVILEVWDVMKLIASGLISVAGTVAKVIGSLGTMDFAGAKQAAVDGFNDLLTVGKNYWEEAKADAAAGAQAQADIMAQIAGGTSGGDTAAPGGGGNAPGGAGSSKGANDAQRAHERLYKQKLDAARDLMRESQRLWDEMTDAELQSVNARLQVNRLALDEQMGNLRRLADFGEITRRQELQGMTDLENQRYQMEADALDQRIALATEDMLEHQRLLDQRVLMEREHQMILREIAATSAMEQRGRFDQLWEGMRSGMQSVIAAGLNLTLSLSNFFRGMAAAIANAMAQMAAKNIATMLMQAAVGKTIRMKEIAADAKAAAAAAYKAVVGIPYIGPFLAPGAAAVAYGATMAFASAAKGYDIPSGVNPMTQLHEREMVLPAKHADVIRSLAERGGSGGSAPPVSVSLSALDGQSAASWLRNGGARLIQEAVMRGLPA